MEQKKYMLNDGEHDVATLTLSDKDWFQGKIITHNGWLLNGTPYDKSDLFVAEFIIKWDGCSHWHFNGEDYTKTGEMDAYYHLCGAGCYMLHIVCLWFAWKCAEMYYMQSDKWNNHFEDYGEMDEFDVIFKNYKIIECK